MKSGIVALIGRPNSGKSTLLNNLLKQKVSITSPKPQTTRFAIQAVYEDDRGQIIFVDTPGIFAKVIDQVSSRINLRTEKVLEQHVDMVVYIVDHSRKRAEEENKSLGIVRKINVPKLLVINKIDIKEPNYMVQYRFMEDEFDKTIELSALTGKNLPLLLEAIFDRLPTRKPLIDTKDMIQPGLNLDSKMFIAEIIREKAFLTLRKEVPYSLTAVVDEVDERENGVLYIKARILTSADRYKGMIIGKNANVIKEIGATARKEMEVASGKKVFIDLSVEVDKHWEEYV